MAFVLGELTTQSTSPPLNFDFYISEDHNLSRSACTIILTYQYFLDFVFSGQFKVKSFLRGTFFYFFYPLILFSFLEKFFRMISAQIMLGPKFSFHSLFSSYRLESLAFHWWIFCQCSLVTLEISWLYLEAFFR
jgi:hypothetical protein